MITDTSSNSALEYRLDNDYTDTKELLLKERPEVLSRPLAYWALPKDRSLPLALLGHPVADVLKLSFREICSTPSIGIKKVQTLLTLLQRVASTDVTQNRAESLPHRGVKEKKKIADRLDPQEVSESQWALWRETVRRFQLEEEGLGRYAVSLKNITKVLWKEPLKAYLSHSLAEIRRLRTHGEKRIYSILETFYCLHQLLNSAGDSHLAQKLLTRNMKNVEEWVLLALVSKEVPSSDEVRRHFSLPIMDQFRQDANKQLLDLGEKWLSGETFQRVTLLAKQQKLTRARIYQLFEEMSLIMEVRWPAGPFLVEKLREKLGEASKLDRSYAGFLRVADLFFPKGKSFSQLQEEPESDLMVV